MRKFTHGPDQFNKNIYEPTVNATTPRMERSSSKLRQFTNSIPIQQLAIPELSKEEVYQEVEKRFADFQLKLREVTGNLHAQEF